MNLKEPVFQDVLDARRVIHPHVHRTPLRRYPALCDLIGADVWVKHENYQVAGSFKVRGGLNLVARTTEAERARGFITASTGNHGQSVAFAAGVYGSNATIVVPEGANPLKVSAMRALGARVLHHGPMFDFAREYAERMAVDDGLRYVHPANEPLLIAGVATYTLEVHEDLGEIDYIFVPVGAGSGASGACIVADTVAPSTRVMAVQSAEAPSAYLSWKQGELVDAQMETEAEGLATASSYDFPQAILRKRLHDFVAVSDQRIKEAAGRFIESTRSLIEYAGASSLGAAMDLKETLAGKRVVLIASGANASMAQLDDSLAAIR
ncbi:MAG: threonine/serine dehydratase [Rhodospirillaceae bacterium]|nr:threonine/serine dehydratase [Rhodospirillaceae bacterium]